MQWSHITVNVKKVGLERWISGCHAEGLFQTPRTYVMAILGCPMDCIWN